MYDENYKCGKKYMCYGRSYVLLQKYENLFSVKDAIESGTIFKDLYMPYNEKKRAIYDLELCYEEK